MAYYDGTKLLSLKDKNGETPTIYICTSNRTAGKTTYFNRLVVNRFIRSGSKFCLLYRYNYELEGCSVKFFNDIKDLFFPKYVMTEKKRSKGIYTELFLSKSYDEPGISCGYAISLNSADNIKKISHVFNDVSCILFDEFQSENNSYVDHEIQKFLSIHKSIARGKGKQYREVPVYMISNHVSLINPYYTELGISTKLRKESRFLKGSGYVLEQGFNESAAAASKESGIAKAFASNKYTQYANDLIYLNDDDTFIERPVGRSVYIATIKYDDHEYAIREYAESNIIYIDEKIDETCKLKISVTIGDHDINYVMVRQYADFIYILRDYFEHGCMRFKNMRCKEALIKLISY